MSLRSQPARCSACMRLSAQMPQFTGLLRAAAQKDCSAAKHFPSGGGGGGGAVARAVVAGGALRGGLGALAVAVQKADSQFGVYGSWKSRKPLHCTAPTITLSPHPPLQSEQVVISTRPLPQLGIALASRSHTAGPWSCLPVCPGCSQCPPRRY